MKSNLNRLKLSHLQNPTLLGQRPTLGGLGSGEFQTSSFILIFIAVGDHVAAGDVASVSAASDDAVGGRAVLNGASADNADKAAGAAKRPGCRP